MLLTAVGIASFIQLLVISAAEIPHVTPNQLLTWPDEAHDYYFVISVSAPDRKLRVPIVFTLSSVYDYSERQLDRK